MARLADRFGQRGVLWSLMLVFAAAAAALIGGATVPSSTGLEERTPRGARA